MVRLRHALGDTWYIETPSKAIPLWRGPGDRAVLVDSGDGGAERGEIDALLQGEGLRVAAILTTHAHRDHVSNHAFFQREHGAGVIAPLHAAGALSTPLGLKSAFEASSLRETLGFAREMLCRVDEVVLPGQAAVTAGGGVFSVLPLPGHAPDHTGYVTPDGVACLGDLFFTPDALAGVRLPYSFCWEADLESRSRALSWDYPAYLLSHRGLCARLEPLAQQNRGLVDDAAGLILSLAATGIPFSCLLAQVNRRLSIRPGSGFKRDAIERSTRSLVHYLQDTGRLLATVSDGVVLYQTAPPH